MESYGCSQDGGVKWGSITPDTRPRTLPETLLLLFLPLFTLLLNAI